MAEKGRIRRMFPGGNTTAGFYSYFRYIAGPDAARVFIIKGGPGVGKSTFMNTISEEMVGRGYDVEHHHCSSDPDSLDGLVIPALKVALLDGTAPHIVDPGNPGAADEIINLGEYWREEEITRHRDEILKTNQKVSRLFGIAYRLLKQSGAAYEEWQGYVEETINRANYNRIVRMMTESVLEGTIGNSRTAPEARHLFGSAITPRGIRDYKETLLTEDMRIFCIKGQPGTGAKQLIARIALSAEEMGLFTEQYHCPFEPDKPDMLIIPAIRTAVIHNTPPYHFDPGDSEGIQPAEEIDLDLCVRRELLEEYEPERADAEARSHDLLQKAVDHLARAMEAHDEMEEYYIQSMDYDRVGKKCGEVLQKILRYER